MYIRFVQHILEFNTKILHTLVLESLHTVRFLKTEVISCDKHPRLPKVNLLNISQSPVYWYNQSNQLTAPAGCRRRPWSYVLRRNHARIGSHSLFMQSEPHDLLYHPRSRKTLLHCQFLAQTKQRLVDLHASDVGIYRQVGMPIVLLFHTEQDINRMNICCVLASFKQV